MVKRVDHGLLSATTTTGWETAKGGIIGTLVSGAIGAALVVGAVFAVTALVGAIAPAATAASAVGVLSSGIGLAGTVAAGVVGFLAGGPIGTAIGSVAGAVRGVGRVKHEKAAYVHRQNVLAGGHAAHQQDIAQQAYMMGMQQGQQIGVQQGQQNVLQELQREREKMIHMQMAEAAAKNPIKGAHTAKVMQERGVAQAMQPQVG